MPECPKCHTQKIVKNGHHLGRQRYRCKSCVFNMLARRPSGARPVKKPQQFCFAL